MTIDNRSRWLALLVLCLGDLMIVLDVTIVGVALPSIREDLGFTETSLAWVVNAYLLTFGGFLLLGGPAGRPLRASAPVPDRHDALHAGLTRLRPRKLAGAPDGSAGGAGPRRSGRFRGRALADDDAVHRAGRPGQGNGHLRLRRLRRRQHRRAARRDPHGRAQLALDLPRQRSRRCPRRRADAEAGAGLPRFRRRTAPRRRGCRHRHRCAHARCLRDRQRQPGGLDVRSRRSGCSAPVQRCSRSSS